MAELTPMMRQYQQVKRQHPDCLLFFRLGDFYEMFSEDAKLAAKELDLTLTTRDRGKEKQEQTPMCGVPYHSAESYIARLVARGYKVAICEQTEDPAQAKGLVQRDIVRIVTPGTVTESSMLDESRNNYFACVYGEGGEFGVSFCDISTGAFCATLAQGQAAADRVLAELGAFSPAELLLGGEAKSDETIAQALREKLHCATEFARDELFSDERCEAALRERIAQLPEGVSESPCVMKSAGALLLALHGRHLTTRHIRAVEYYVSGRFMELDLTARRNLELTASLHAGEKRGSLLWVLDKTRTPMGGRLLRAWLEQPLLSPKRISLRLDAVQELLEHSERREELREHLRALNDLERITARIVTGTANARDLRAFAVGSRPLPALRDGVRTGKAAMFEVLRSEIDGLDDLREMVERAIVDEPPFTVREGGMLRDGYCAELDELRDIVSGGKGTLAAIETKEKERTGIKNLRVGYNRVFGYYIEVAKGQVSLVPEEYIRKQTLTNGERYITPELKELEGKILTARERIVALEYERFTDLRLRLSDQADRILRTAKAVACLDVLCGLAAVAEKNGYCRPEVDLSDRIEISEGRHPVVEQMLDGSLFVPNDALLDCAQNRALILTGPNMAGKSTYMRQVALIVLMAQIGSFVPAASARIGVVDRIFTRIGASDDLSSGKSTFMVEMSEVADILRHATPRSLLILDEIGRGTSTFDGMAIARAVLEYAADPKRIGAKTLFATHYHELTELEREVGGVKNFHVAVKKRGAEIVFLRRIVPGGADDSYGVEVAKLAGLPDRLITRAREILKELESGAPTRTVTVAAEDQISILSMENDRLREELEKLDVNTLTPIEAMNELFRLKKML